MAKTTSNRMVFFDLGEDVFGALKGMALKVRNCR